MIHAFVTGTDTGVGKTAVAAGLLAAGRRAGITTAAMKPVESGIDPTRVSDAQFLREAAGSTPRPALRWSPGSRSAQRPRVRR
jgi:dethiobiotin synthetase